MSPQEPDLTDLTDNEVIERARHLQGRLRVVSRMAAENDALIREWGTVCREMGRRGMNDTVTEGGPHNVLEPLFPELAP